MDCYTCKHRGTLPGSCHSRCLHPKALAAKSPLGELLGMLASVGRVPPLVVNSEVKIVLDPHGVKHGWANWPYNFDPIWVTSCDGYEVKV